MGVGIRLLTVCDFSNSAFLLIALILAFPALSLALGLAGHVCPAPALIFLAMTLTETLVLPALSLTLFPVLALDVALILVRNPALVLSSALE